MSVCAEKRDTEYWLVCDGPTPYFEHGSAAFVRDDPWGRIAAMPRIMKRIESGQRVDLSKTLVQKLGVHKWWAEKSARNIAYNLMATQILGTSFVTDNNVDTLFLNWFSGDHRIENTNSVVARHLVSIVPFLEDVRIPDLIRVRDRERESFILYRQALKEAIGNFRNKATAFTEKEAQEVYSDVIAPRLTLLDRRVSIAKRDLMSKPLRSLVGLAGAITFGIYTGIIPAELAEIARTIGFTKLGADILEKIMAVGDSKKAIREDHMYFLWKVHRKTKRKH
jgi:hypothetical protein